METGTLYTTSLQRSRSSILPHLTFPAPQPDSALAKAAVRLANRYLDTAAGLGQRGEFLPQTHLHAGVAVQRLAQRLIQQRLVDG